MVGGGCEPDRAERNSNRSREEEALLALSLFLKKMVTSRGWNGSYFWKLISGGKTWKRGSSMSTMLSGWFERSRRL